MSTTFIDSDVLIDVLRQVPQAITVLDVVRRQTLLAVSVIVRLEIVVGSANREALQRTERLLKQTRVVQLSEEISELADKLVTQFYLSRSLLIADALIAATAMVHDAPLLTKNQRDFRFIPGLKLLPYPAPPTATA